MGTTTTKKILLMGGIVMDRYFIVNRMPARGEDAFFYDEFNLVGGCMLNTGATVQNLGGDLTMVSCLGNDAIGREIAAYLDEHGFDRTLIYDVDGPTGNCLIFSEPDGERTFIGRNGVELRFTEAMQQDVLKMDPSVVGVTGFFLVGEDALRIVDTVRTLKERGSKVLFDPSSLAGDVKPEILRAMIDVSDVITPNAIELEMLKRVMGAAGETTVGTAAVSKADWTDNDLLALLTSQGKTIFFKEGEKGGTIYSPDGIIPYAAVTLGEVVDSNGAGDSFFGGLAVAYAEGLPLDETANLASWCGARTCTIRGPHGFWKK